MHGKKLGILFLYLYASIGFANAIPLSFAGYSGPVYFNGNYSIDSSSAPGVFYDDEGLAKYEMIYLNPKKTAVSDKYAYYSESFDTDKWRNESSTFYGMDRSVNTVMANETVLYPSLKDKQAYVRDRKSVV
jgi:hypothetical protein